MRRQGYGLKVGGLWCRNCANIMQTFTLLNLPTGPVDPQRMACTFSISASSSTYQNSNSKQNWFPEHSGNVTF